MGYRKTGTARDKNWRRREVSILYFQGYSIEEIADQAEYSLDTIRRDVKYIEKHKEEYFI